MAVRPEREVATLQRLPYFVGVSGSTVGSRGLSMHLVVIRQGPGQSTTSMWATKPASACSKAGVLTRWGLYLEHETVSEAGDFLFVPPGVPHEAVNLSATQPARAVIARTDPSEQDKVVPHRPGPA